VTQGPIRAGERRRWIAAAAGLVLAATLLTACSAARTGLGTSDESCYLALPTAAKAVGGHGHLEGVRKYSVSGLRSVAPRLYGRYAQDLPKGKSVCLAAYTGHFSESTVTKPVGRSSGTLAIAIVQTPGNTLLATLILTKTPVRFKHIF
jgi:hypothetical protein